MKEPSKGMTLIEILITLAIIAGVVVFTVSSLGGGSATRQIRLASQNIVRTIRYVYDTTLVKGLCYRIVFDLDAQKIFVEYSENPFAVKQETEESLKEEKDKVDEEKNADEEKNKGDEIDFDSEINTFDEDKNSEKNTILPPQTADFVAAEDDLVEPFDLPKKVRVVDVFVAHQLAKIDQGKAYLHFFPKGYTEYAIIHVGDADGEKFFTLIVNPLTGEVDVRDGYLEKEEIEENP